MIDGFPVEIWGAIFKIYVREAFEALTLAPEALITFASNDPPIKVDDETRNRFPYNASMLGAVCKAWRRATLRTPTLWADIVGFYLWRVEYASPEAVNTSLPVAIPAPHLVAENCRHIQQYLTRSGTCSIDLKLFNVPNNWNISFQPAHELLVNELPRIRHLQIDFQRCIPANQPYPHIADLRQRAPRLRSISFTVSDTPHHIVRAPPISDLTPPSRPNTPYWDALEHLDIADLGLSPQAVVATLLSGPNLRTLDLCYVPRRSDATQGAVWAMPAVALPHLDQLSITGMVLQALFDGRAHLFTMPSLRILRIGRLVGSALSVFKALCFHAFNSTHELHMSGEPYSDAPVIDADTARALDGLPNLSTLRLIDIEVTRDFFQTFLDFTGNPRMSRLSSIELNDLKYRPPTSSIPGRPHPQPFLDYLRARTRMAMARESGTNRGESIPFVVVGRWAFDYGIQSEVDTILGREAPHLPKPSRMDETFSRADMIWN